MGILDGRVAVVTGSGRGIGREFALSMAREGANIVINDVGVSLDGQGTDEDPAAQTVADIKALGVGAIASYGSVTDYDAAGQTIQAAIDEFGTIDILVNNAGIVRDRSLLKMTPEDFDAVVKVHMYGTFNMAQHAAGHMKEAGYGRIINGLAYDGQRLYVPISDPGVPPEKSAAGLHAVNPANGKVLWSWRAAPDCDNGRDARVAGCRAHAGLSAAPMVIDQAVVAGALDGRLWIFDAASGKVLAMHDTVQPFTTRNGVPASGGAIDAAGVFAGNGMLFVNSGYSQFGQQPGNVLIAYGPRP